MGLFMINRKTLSNKGFSLVETLIVIGIISGIAGTIAFITTNLTKSVIYADSRTNVTLLMNTANQAIKNPDACSSSLKGLNLTNNSPLSIKEPFSNITLLQEGLKRNGFEVTYVRFSDVRKDPASNTGFANLNIHYSVKKGDITVPLEKKIGVVVNVDPANKILGCAASDHYVPGAQYGGCFQELNASFQVVAGTSLVYPMVRCPSSGTGPTSMPECAPGFTVFVNFFSQGNTGATGGFNDQLDYYWKSTTCVKNL